MPPPRLRISKAELAKELADRDWWRTVAHALDMELVGWTYRHVATFRRGKGLDWHGFECPGDVAEKIHELLSGVAPRHSGTE